MSRDNTKVAMRKAARRHMIWAIVFLFASGCLAADLVRTGGVREAIGGALCVMNAVASGTRIRAAQVLFRIAR